MQDSSVSVAEISLISCDSLSQPAHPGTRPWCNLNPKYSRALGLLSSGIRCYECIPQKKQLEIASSHLERSLKLITDKCTRFKSRSGFTCSQFFSLFPSNLRPGLVTDQKLPVGRQRQLQRKSNRSQKVQPQK